MLFSHFLIGNLVNRWILIFQIVVKLELPRISNRLLDRFQNNRTPKSFLRTSYYRVKVFWNFIFICYFSFIFNFVVCYHFLFSFSFSFINTNAISLISDGLKKSFLTSFPLISLLIKYQKYVRIFEIPALHVYAHMLKRFSFRRDGKKEYLEWKKVGSACWLFLLVWRTDQRFAILSLR